MTCLARSFSAMILSISMNGIRAWTVGEYFVFFLENFLHYLEVIEAGNTVIRLVCETKFRDISSSGVNLSNL